MNWRSLLYYQTHKVVQISDPRLGALYYFLCALVMCYVVLFQIIYLNQHFARTPVTGLGRITLRPPTLGCDPNEPSCEGDFRPLTEIPYCTQYAGGDAAPRQRVCDYYDAQALTGSGTMVAGQLLIPTRIGTVHEHRECEASEANGWSCRRLYQRMPEDPNVTQRYVADIDRYNLVLSHVFHSEQDTGNSIMYRGTYRTCEHPSDGAPIGHGDPVVNASLNAARFFTGKTECDGGHWKVTPIECDGDECGWIRPLTQTEDDCMPDPDEAAFLASRSASARVDVEPAPEPSQARLRRKRRKRRLHRPQSLLELGEKHAPFGEPEPPEPGPSPEARSLVAREKKPPGIHAVKAGDVFSLAELLRLAGTELDGGDTTHHSHNQDCSSFRDAGIIVEIEARYTNLEPWVSSFRYNDNSKVHYEYQVRARPVGEIEAAQLSANQPADFPNVRAIEHRHGLYVTLKVTGEFGEFSIVFFLVMLTTSLTLLAVVAKAVDVLAMYVLAHREEYNKFKYEVTPEVDSSQAFLDRTLFGLSARTQPTARTEPSA